jgi:hypothetical protein
MLPQSRASAPRGALHVIIGDDLLREAARTRPIEKSMTEERRFAVIFGNGILRHRHVDDGARGMTVLGPATPRQ